MRVALVCFVLLLIAFLAGGVVEMLTADNYTVEHTIQTSDYDYYSHHRSDDDMIVRQWCISLGGDCVIVVPER